MKRRRLIIATSAAAAVCASPFSLVYAGLLPGGVLLDRFSPRGRFVRQWHTRLTACASPTAARDLLKHNREGGGTVTMADGSWVAVVMEHACCTGAGFNATLYVTSAGNTVLDTTSTYCGWLPLEEELQGYPKTGAGAFLAAVRANGKTLTRL